MSVFASKAGNFTINVDSGPSRGETPMLKVPNLVSKNLVRVTVDFSAQSQSGSGFVFQIKATEAAKVTALSPTQAFVSNTSGWVSATRSAFFLVNPTGQDPTTEIDFECVFEAGSFSGTSEGSDFLIRAQVVGLQA